MNRPARFISSDPAAGRPVKGTLALWRNILDSLGAGVIVLSPRLELIAINSAAQGLIGGARPNPAQIQELMGANPWLAEMVRDCLATGSEMSVAEAKLVSGAQKVPVAAHLSPLLDDEAGLAGTVIMLLDLAYRYAATHPAGVNSSDGAMGLSPAGLAHEVKNPLTGIKGAAELLTGLFPEEHRGRQYCELILNGADRIADLVEKVLSVSSPQRLKRERVNIHQVLHQALRTAGIFPLDPHSVTIEQRFDPSLPEIAGDSAALERVFLNLIRNALEAIAPPGRLRLQTRMETEFHLNANGRKQHFLRVEVSDSGKGMTDEEMAQLFTPFFTTKPQGTGLGLALSQQIVGFHGGKLRASRSGELGGMTFKVTLPLIMGEPPASPSSRSNPTPESSE
ncbi:MAG TPA: ATP-binding protein [Candidatus Binataceae bacterium]|nr:ATP-binding protein [Candidatus Binataceae bacterium]